MLEVSSVVNLELPDVPELLDSGPSRAHLEVPDVPELLSSGPSRTLSLVCARCICCCFFNIGLSKWSKFCVLSSLESEFEIYYS
jgi:hypothetical protein